jgi:hypothetical protein
LSSSVDIDIYDYQNKIITCIESSLSDHDRLVIDSYIYKKKTDIFSKKVDLLDLLGFTYSERVFDD